MNRGFVLTGNYLIITSALFISIFYNSSYYQKVLELYPVSITQSAFLFSVFGLQFTTTILLICLFSIKGLLKPFIILLLLSSAVSSFIMDNFGTAVDPYTISQFFTYKKPSMDLLSINFLMFFIFLGLIPAIIVYKIPVKFKLLKAELIVRFQLIALALGTAILIILLFYSNYNSIFKINNSAKYYSNPIYFIYSGIDSLIDFLSSPNELLNPAGEDAIIVELDNDRELVIFVIGEAARADRFSLNGYHRETNPLLKHHQLISFKEFTSCGTSTLISIDCIFSANKIDSYKEQVPQNRTSLMDVLNYAGVNVLWRDNNKRVLKYTSKIDYENYRNPNNNPVCDSECRDIGMLAGLQDYIDTLDTGDIFIVLHQIGSQGPAYYKRYPEGFETFTPTCQTSQLLNCTQQEINNAYDNTIRYTDYFLNQTIELLKKNEGNFETALFYVSDHGESLGEKGVYLHGLPTFIAPKSQVHVASLIWAGPSNHHVNHDIVSRKETLPLSHDHLFHTLLGLFEIQTQLYDPSLDILSNSW